ncbi:MAG: acyl dehydratase [Microbacteriaceae bacterium]|jgi:acyl dehydratase|nr:acyl dehydratase [Microbacteriaceae bacterium]MCI1206851.1 acyl dehydratase [Microbacteriaceae bacterium]
MRPEQQLPEIVEGAALGPIPVHLTRESMVRYAGASGDFNPIHYRDDVARAAGLPGVLAHGMLTMGVAVGPLVDWLAGGDPGRVLDYGVRFTRPVVVDPELGADLQVVVRVTGLDADTIRASLEVSFDGRSVLGAAKAVVRR